MLGELGNDTLGGGDEDDALTGGSGTDTLAGDAGDDRLAGGSDDDMLVDGSGGDLLSGGSGNDSIGDPGPGAYDGIYCGKGRDFVEASSIDYVAPDCETVERY